MPWSDREIPDQTGRTAVVTGANGGLGLETTRELARRGARVVMAVRNRDKADAAVVAIRVDVADARLVADPGFAATDLQAHSFRTAGGLSQRFFYTMVGRFGATPLVGALPQLRAATDPDAKGGGLYALRWVAHGAPVRIARGRRSNDRKSRKILWDVSERETGIRFDVRSSARMAAT